jgi:predicted dinucleotide-binding enzyme
MRIGVLGTGWVGRAIGGKLAEIGHDVTIGTRDPVALMARTESDPYGPPPFSIWHTDRPQVGVGTFADAARDAEMIVNATQGAASLAALGAGGEASLDGKVVIDISNPLDFSHGMPPSLFVCNTDSLGEQIQAAFPGAKVVKTLNTVTADVMVDPHSVGDGEHTVYVSGNDAGAKAEVTSLLTDGFGWKHVMDLGGIETARAVEMALPLWLAIVMKTNDRMFNFSVVR